MENLSSLIKGVQLVSRAESRHTRLLTESFLLRRNADRQSDAPVGHPATGNARDQHVRVLPRGRHCRPHRDAQSRPPVHRHGDDRGQLVSIKTDFANASRPTVLTDPTRCIQVYRFRVKEGSFVRLQSRWKSFRNPWTKEIECLVAKNAYIQ